jgi:hypothetical protein
VLTTLGLVPAALGVIIQIVFVLFFREILMILSRSRLGLLLFVKVRESVRVLAQIGPRRVQIGFMIQIRVELMWDLNDLSRVRDNVDHLDLSWLLLARQVQLRNVIEICHLILEVKLLPIVWWDYRRLFVLSFTWHCQLIPPDTRLGVTLLRFIANIGDLVVTGAYIIEP